MGPMQGAGSKQYTWGSRLEGYLIKERLDVDACASAGKKAGNRKFKLLK